MKKTNRICFYVTLLLSFVAGALAAAYFFNCREIGQKLRILDSIPLRDDQRRQSFLRAEAPIEDATLIDDTTLLYRSGACLRLRNLKETTPEIVFQAHSQPVQAFRVSPDRRQAVSSSTDGTLRLWDVRSGECLAVSEPVDTTAQPYWTLLNEIVFHPDGKTIRTADMEGFKTWRTDDLSLLSSEESDILYMCNGLLSPDWKTLCVPVLDEGFQVVSCKDEGTLEYIGGKSPHAYSPDGKRVLAFNAENGTMEIWDIGPSAGKRWSVLWLYSPSVPLLDAAFSPDGKQLVSAHGDGTVRIWNARNGAEREVLHWNALSIDGVCFSPDGLRVVAWNEASGEICSWGPFSWMI